MIFFFLLHSLHICQSFPNSNFFIFNFNVIDYKLELLLALLVCSANGHIYVDKIHLKQSKNAHSCQDSSTRKSLCMIIYPEL